jgi:hypothetical protein
MCLSKSWITSPRGSLVIKASATAGASSPLSLTFSLLCHHSTYSIDGLAAIRNMSETNLPTTAMDVDEAAIDEGLYSRQLYVS